MITDKEVLDTSKYLTELQNKMYKEIFDNIPKYLTELQNKMYKEIFDNIPKNPDELQKRVWLNIYGRRKRIPTNISGRILYINYKKSSTVTYTLKEGTDIIYSFEKDSSYINGTTFSETPIVDDVLCTLSEESLVTGSN